MPRNQGEDEKKRAAPPDASQLQGISYDTARQSYKARIFFAGKARYVGRYKSMVAAAQAYDQAARHVNSLLQAVEGNSKKRLRSLNFPDKHTEDARLAQRLKTIFRSDMLGPASAGAAAEPSEVTQQTASRGEQAGSDSEGAESAGQEQAQDQHIPPAEPRALPPGVAGAQPQPQPAAAAEHAQAAGGRQVAEGNQAARDPAAEAQSMPVRNSLDVQHSPDDADARQHRQQEHASRAQSQESSPAPWQQHQQQQPAVAPDAAGDTPLPRMQPRAPRAASAGAMPDPCSMPLLPVDAMNDTDWQNLLAAVVAGVPGSGAAGHASTLQRNAAEDSAVLAAARQQQGAASSSSAAAALMAPLLQPRRVLQLRQHSAPAYGSMLPSSVMHPRNTGASAAALEHILLAHSGLRSSHGQEVNTLASAAPATALPAVGVFPRLAGAYMAHSTSSGGQVVLRAAAAPLAPPTPLPLFRGMARTAAAQACPQRTGAAAAGAEAAGLLSCIETPVQALQVVSKALLCLQDVSAHLLQQYQQHSPISPLRPLSEWLQAAWYTEALGRGPLSPDAMPRTISAAVTAAKSARPDSAAPNRLALHMLDKLLLVLLQVVDGRGVGLLGGPWGFVCEVLQMLQEGLAAVHVAVQAAAAAEPPVHVGFRQLLQAWVTSQHGPGGSDRHGWVVSTVMRLAEQL